MHPPDPHDAGPPDSTTGPAEADPARTLEPSPESSTAKVTRAVLHDTEGDCLIVDLSGQHVDEKVAADVILPPWRCLHLVADGDVTFSRAGVQRLVWRSGGRCIVTTDDLPPAMAEAYAAEALAWLDWLKAAA